jgi:hypothetical protein
MVKPKPKILKPVVVSSKDIEEELNKEKLDKLTQRRIDDSFRRANDIRYKEPKDLKDWQLPLFYELKIAEEIKALDDEIEEQDRERLADK